MISSDMDDEAQSCSLSASSATSSSSLTTLPPLLCTAAPRVLQKSFRLCTMLAMLVQTVSIDRLLLIVFHYSGHACFAMLASSNEMRCSLKFGSSLVATASARWGLCPYPEFAADVMIDGILWLLRTLLESWLVLSERWKPLIPDEVWCLFLSWSSGCDLRGCHRNSRVSSGRCQKREKT
jgi:hypothetical protein